MTPTVRALTTTDTPDVASLLGRHFVTGSVLHSALGVDAGAWQAHLAPDLDSAVASDCSVVAESADGSLIGCVLAWACAHTTLATNDQSDPLHALLVALRRGAPAPDDNTLHVDMAVVAPGGRGAGLYRRMREAVHSRGRNAGFSSVRGELSSAATQTVCRTQFGHTVLHEIAYASFTWRGERPFSGIDAPPSIQLVEGPL